MYTMKILHKQADKHTIIKVYLLVRDILGSDGVLHTAVLVVYQVTKKTITRRW